MARTHARGITYFWSLNEKAEAGVRVGIELQLDREPDDFRSGWAALRVNGLVSFNG